MMMDLAAESESSWVVEFATTECTREGESFFISVCVIGVLSPELQSSGPPSREWLYMQLSNFLSQLCPPFGEALSDMMYANLMMKD